MGKNDDPLLSGGKASRKSHLGKNNDPLLSGGKTPKKSRPAQDELVVGQSSIDPFLFSDKVSSDQPRGKKDPLSSPKGKPANFDKNLQSGGSTSARMGFYGKVAKSANSGKPENFDNRFMKGGSSAARFAAWNAAAGAINKPLKQDIKWNSKKITLFALFFLAFYGAGIVILSAVSKFMMALFIIIPAICLLIFYIINRLTKDM
ncbi:MAG: hypothetical protein ACFBSC_10980 [Microcoleaceae cyanobacterium]